MILREFARSFRSFPYGSIGHVALQVEWRTTHVGRALNRARTRRAAVRINTADSVSGWPSACIALRNIADRLDQHLQRAGWPRATARSW